MFSPFIWFLLLRKPGLNVPRPERATQNLPHSVPGIGVSELGASLIFPPSWRVAAGFGSVPGSGFPEAGTAPNFPD